MSIKKPIVVKLDRFNEKDKNHNKPVLKKVKPMMSQEAAATEESSEDQMQTFAREYDQSFMLTDSNTSKKNKFNIFKPILIAILSAIVIGSIMGFIMLRIIVNFDNDLHATPSFVLQDKDNGVSEKATKETGEEQTTTSTSMITLGAMEAFVLQGGVFSTAANAEKEADKFIVLGYTPFIWERDNQFYLLVNLAATKEAVQANAEQLTTNGIDVYAKEWKISESELELTKVEHDWLVLFQETWLKQIQDDVADTSAWQELMNQTPSQSEQLTSFTASIQGMVEQLAATNGNDVDHILLKMGKTYESFVAEEEKMNLE